MDTRSIWIYENAQGDQNTIEFMGLQGEQPDAVVLKEFLADRDYTVVATSEDLDAGSYRYDVSPPLSTEHIREFGALFIGCYTHGKWFQPMFDIDRRGVVVVDHRTSQLVHGLGREVVRQ